MYTLQLWQQFYDYSNCNESFLSATQHKQFTHSTQHIRLHFGNIFGIYMYIVHCGLYSVNTIHLNFVSMQLKNSQCIQLFDAKIHTTLCALHWLRLAKETYTRPRPFIYIIHNFYYRYSHFSMSEK